MSPTPLIVTLMFDDPTFTTLDGLRRQHFPPERNFIPAHITLFHALPGDQEQRISDTLATTCATTPVIDLAFSGLHFMGRGVAIKVDAPALVALRGELAGSWQPWLTAQDQQRYRPHVTIQNKVAADQARQLYNQLNGSWQPFAGQGVGLMLWRYLGGPWQRAGAWRFGTNESL